VSRFVESADKDQDADHIREFLAAEGGEVMISPDPRRLAPARRSAYRLRNLMRAPSANSRTHGIETRYYIRLHGTPCRRLPRCRRYASTAMSPAPRDLMLIEKRRPDATTA
jgi:hypothetical protein